ncbi:MAG: glycosyltransferase [Anaerolineae bacterium]|nr:glycosyltransferase [Anaerolineae bacterium]
MTQPLILHTITELNRGGAEQLLVNMLQHASQSTAPRFRHHVVTLYDGDTPLAQQIRQMGIPVTDLQMKSAGRFSALLRFWQLLRRERPLVIHNWLYHASLMGRVFGRLARVPVILTALHSVHLGSPWRECLHRWTGHLDDRTILICNFLRQREFGPSSRYVTIYNGIPTLHFPPVDTARIELRAELHIPAESLIALTTGRLHPDKGHADLISVIARLIARRPDLHFVWAGDGEQRQWLEQQLTRQQLTSHVHLLGSRADVPYLLAASDLFVMPSHWEGASLAILEAMSAGLPVIATAVGGTPELIGDGETGLLVPPHEPEAMVQAILALLEQPEKAAQLARNGRQRVAEHFTIARMFEQTETLYTRLLQAKLKTDFQEC